MSVLRQLGRSVAATLLACVALGPGAGCVWGALGTGVFFAVDEDGGGSSPAMPTLQLTAGLERSGLADEAGAASADRIAIAYQIVGAEGPFDLRASWRPAGDGDFAEATAAPAGNGTRGLPAGQTLRFVWEAAADLAVAGLEEAMVDVRLEPMLAQAVGVGQEVRVRVGNRAPAIAIQPDPTVQSRTVLTRLQVSDSASDLCAVTLAVRAPGEPALPVANVLVAPGEPTEVAATPGGRATTYAWDSLAALGLSNIASLEVIAAATDRFGLSTVATSTIKLRNDTPSTIDVLSFGTPSGLARVDGRIPITFAVFDAEADIDPNGARGGLPAVRVEVSDDGGQTFQPATGLTIREAGRTIGVPDLSGLRADLFPAGSDGSGPNVHTFLWDAAADGMSGMGARAALVRLTPLPDGLGEQVSLPLGEVVVPFGEAIATIDGSFAHLAVADLDGDGDPDLVVQRVVSKTTSVVETHRGGDGAAFGAAASTGLATLSAIGDVSGDGIVDLVGTDTSTLPAVARGRGDGTFDLPLPLEAGAPTGVLRLAELLDLDGDGRLDLLGIASAPPGLFLRRGLAAAPWLGPAIPLDSGDPKGLGSAQRMALDDLDGDAAPELVVVKSPAKGAPPELEVLRIDGGAATVSSTQRLFVEDIGPVVIVDVDADGHPDVLVDRKERSLDIEVLLGGPGGVLAPPVTGFPVRSLRLLSEGPTDLIGQPTPDGPRWHTLPDRVLADVDGDDLADLFVIGPGALTVFAGRPGAGVELDEVFLEAGRAPIVADVDGDGRNDVVTRGFIDLHAFLQTPLGLVAGPDLTVGTVTVHALADLQGDGLPEALTGSNEIAIYRALGAPELFDPVATRSTTPKLVSLLLADIDGDGHLDAALGQAKALSVRLGRPDGDLAASPTLDIASSGGAIELAVGDLDGDGRLDVAGSSVVDGSFVVFGDPAQAPLPAAVPLGDGSHRVFSVADLDGDGRAELGTGGGIYRLDADRSLLVVGPGQSLSGAAVDANGDGRLDVVSAKADLLRLALAAPPRGAAPAARGDGSGGAALRFLTHDIPTTLGTLDAPGTGDLSGDGVADVVVSTLGLASDAQVLATSGAFASTPGPIPGTRRVRVPPLRLDLASSLALERLVPASDAFALSPEGTALASPTSVTVPLAAWLTAEELASGSFRAFVSDRTLLADPVRIDPRTGLRTFDHVSEVARTDVAGAPTGLAEAVIDPVAGTISFPIDRLARYQVFIERAPRVEVLFRETFDGVGERLPGRVRHPAGWQGNLVWQCGAPSGSDRPVAGSAPNLLAAGLRGSPTGTLDVAIVSPVFGYTPQPPARGVLVRGLIYHALAGGQDFVDLALVVGRRTATGIVEARRRAEPDPLVDGTFTGASTEVPVLAPFEMDVTSLIDDALVDPVFDGLTFTQPDQLEIRLELRLRTQTAESVGFFIDDLEVVLTDAP